MSTLPKTAIREDNRLERLASSASEELARHRWHWTLNTDNPKRVPVREYARQVGRAHKTIDAQVNGYALFVRGTPHSLNECIERAKMGAEKAELVEAVAEANKVGLQQARKVYSSDVSRVRDAVERQAERKPDMSAEERGDYTRRVAEMMARSRRSEAERKSKAKSRTASLVLIDSKLIHARRDVEDAIAEARRAGLDEDAVEYLDSSLDKLQSATKLLRLAIAGSVDVDWDAELAKLSGTP